MKKLWKSFMAWWMPIAEKIGYFMNRVILSVFYFILVLPFGLGVRLFSDRLQLRKNYNTGWSKSPTQLRSLEDARKQF